METVQTSVNIITLYRVGAAKKEEKRTKKKQRTQLCGVSVLFVKIILKSSRAQDFPPRWVVRAENTSKRRAWMCEWVSWTTEKRGEKRKYTTWAWFSCFLSFPHPHATTSTPHVSTFVFARNIIFHSFSLSQRSDGARELLSPCFLALNTCRKLGNTRFLIFWLALCM